MKTLVSLGLLAAALSARANLFNGDFSAGNVGFGSDYTYDASNLYPEGDYTVNADPHNVHGSWASFGDHTSGTGQMLVVNGSGNAAKAFWKQSVALVPNTDYVFSFWGASSYPTEPANLVFSIDGATKGAAQLTSTTGTWAQYTMGFHSGAGTSAQFALTDADTVPGGNDFAVDDLKVQAVPEPASLAALGLGALGLLKRRRRAKSV